MNIKRNKKVTSHLERILAQEAKLDFVERATNPEMKNLISCFEIESNKIGDMVTRENIGRCIQSRTDKEERMKVQVIRL